MLALGTLRSVSHRRIPNFQHSLNKTAELTGSNGVILYLTVLYTILGMIYKLDSIKATSKPSNKVYFLDCVFS